MKNKLEKQKKLLIVAHGSSLRALISLLNPRLVKEEIKDFNIPTAIPMIIYCNKKLESLKIEYLGEES